MLTLERQAARSVRHDLHVDREDIRFWNSGPEVVEIEFTVRNEGPDRSAPTDAVIQAAPLGAFVAWRTLGRVPVPAIDPGDEVIVRTRASCDPPPTGAAPETLSPAQFLTARGLFDRRRRETSSDPASLGRLPVDILRAIMRGGTHWAGNLNVFVGPKATERHMARSLRVVPGCCNQAMFCVGDGCDAYRFRLGGEAEAWNARLGDGAVPVGEWVGGAHLILVDLQFEPPADCAAGTLEVHVEQQSTGTEAIVEFGFDAEAEGPGCYSL
jgi:hypothetical protein